MMENCYLVNMTKKLTIHFKSTLSSYSALIDVIRSSSSVIIIIVIMFIIVTTSIINNNDTNDVDNNSNDNKEVRWLSGIAVVS